MRYAACNEMFAGLAPEEVYPGLRNMGYTGLEVAPFTLADGWDRDPQATFDVRDVSAVQRREFRTRVEDSGLEVVGLHWLLSRTSGFHLTSPDAEVRRRTASYFAALADLCGDLGGQVMVLGSPPQRNLLSGVTHEQGEQFAAEVLRDAMSRCAERGVVIALEPLGPAEGNFLLTAAAGAALAERVDSPYCRLHLDMKAMSSEATPMDQLIRENASRLAHFHANDPNLLGPGMGDLPVAPVLAALHEIGYDGWISVEAFRYEPSPLELAQTSIENLRQAAAGA